MSPLGIFLAGWFAGILTVGFFALVAGAFLQAPGDLEDPPGPKLRPRKDE